LTEQTTMEILHPIRGTVALAVGLSLAVVLLWMGRRRRQRVLDEWLPGRGGAETDVSYRKRAWRGGLLLLAIALLGMGIARPRLHGERLAEVQPGDVILVLDCSRSMLAEDVPASRFAQARAIARHLALEAPARRFGLVAFAGESFVECPLTEDRQMLCLFLDRLTVRTIPLPGTSLHQALAGGMQAGSHAPAAVVLLTDGEETVTKAEPPRIPEGVGLMVVGVGDPALASPIPTPDGPLIDPNTGQPATSRPDFAGLRKLAGAMGGGFLVADDRTVSTIDEWLRHRFRSGAAETQKVEAGADLYPAFALAALLLLCVRWLLDERRCRAALTAAIVLLGVRSTAGIEGGYGQALALLREKQFTEAVAAWQELAKLPDLSPKRQLAIRLNLGVAQHLLGRQLGREPSGRAKALAAYAQAEACYKDCLWDGAQSPRAVRNLARLAQDRETLTSPAPPPSEAEKPEAATKPPPEAGRMDQPSKETGGAESEGDTEGAEARKPEPEPDLTPAEAAQAVQAMREQEGDFNEALRRRQARSWRTIPPKRPW
jgi:Ca-activated chloride channel family protein